MLLLVKCRNAFELFWESLDSQEKLIVAYACAAALMSVLSRVWSIERARARQEMAGWLNVELARREREWEARHAEVQ